MTIPLSGATYANVTARFSSWSLDVHIRIRGEAINLVVPKSLARSRLMPRTTRRLIHSSYESERARARTTCKMLSFSLTRYRSTARKSRNTAAASRSTRETVRGGHRNRRVACKKPNDPWIFSLCTMIHTMFASQRRRDIPPRRIF